MASPTRASRLRRPPRGRKTGLRAAKPSTTAQPAAPQATEAASEASLEGAVEAMRRRLRAAAHEIRTPLTGAMAIADLLAAADLRDPVLQDYAGLLQDAVRQMAAVANDILDLGRLEAGGQGSDQEGRTADPAAGARLGLGPMEAYDPLALLRAAAGLAAPRAERAGLRLGVEAPDLPARLAGRPLALRRILGNLLDNALKHTRAGGITLRARVEGDLLQLAVEDTGIGIEPHLLPGLFEPYAQLAPGVQAGGTGLGLALVRATVEELGGTVAAESAPGQGTTVRVELPATAPLEPHMELPVRTGRQPRRPLAVLVVDDNPVNRLVAGAMLGGFGHEIAFAGDGAAALAAMASGRSFDVVLMDLEMPGLDGRSALRQVLDADGSTPLAHPPVLAMSARGEEMRAEVLGLGFQGYVTKPFDPAALFAAIEAATA